MGTQISADDMYLLSKLDQMRELAIRLELHMPDVAQGIGRACITMSKTIILWDRSTAEGRFQRRIAANRMKMILRDITLLSAKVQDHLNQGGN